MNSSYTWTLFVVLAATVLGQTLFILHERAQEMVIHTHAMPGKQICVLGFSSESNALEKTSLQCDEQREIVPRIWVDCNCSAGPKE